MVVVVVVVPDPLQSSTSTLVYAAVPSVSSAVLAVTLNWRVSWLKLSATMLHVVVDPLTVHSPPDHGS